MKIRKVSVKPAYFAWFAIFFVNMNMLLKRKTMEKGKRNTFLFCFYMDKFDENSFRV